MKKNYLMINILPLFLHILFLPFWFFENPSIQENVKFFEICYHLFFCLFLLITNFIYAFNKKRGILYLNFFLMILLTAISAIMIFFNYSFSSGRYFNLIYKDINFLFYLFIIPAIAITISTCIYQIFFVFYRYIHRRNVEK
jgi:hypothetical protein